MGEIFIIPGNNEELKHFKKVIPDSNDNNGYVPQGKPWTQSSAAELRDIYPPTLSV
ncbi:MAG: hypothetical protein NTW49_14115 [Bacteroidia bacterium]|nr:hypothetical protein [Bacteroidia bacterium]